MLNEENIWMFLESCENLYMLKLLHDGGFNVSNMGDFCVENDQFSGIGQDLFYQAIRKMFGSYECTSDEENDPYEVQRFWVPCRQLEVLLQHLDEAFVLKHIKPYLHGESDYWSSEMMIHIDDMKKGFHFEIHDMSGSCAGFIRQLLSLRKKLDLLSTLIIEKPKVEKSYAQLYGSI